MSEIQTMPPGWIARAPQRARQRRADILRRAVRQYASERDADSDAAVTERLRELGMACIECADPTHANGLCRRHYRRARRAA